MTHHDQPTAAATYNEEASRKFTAGVRGALNPLCKWGPRPSSATVAAAVHHVSALADDYLKAVRAAHNRTLADLDAARQANGELHDDVERLETAATKTARTLAGLRTDLAGVRAERDDLAGRLLESEASWGAVAAERDQLAEQVADLQGRLAMGRDAAPEPHPAPPAPLPRRRSGSARPASKAQDAEPATTHTPATPSPAKPSTGRTEPRDKP